MNPYQIVKEFEDKLGQFVGSPYAVAVDSCTNALFLCCKYLQVEKVVLPNRTYISVPGAVLHAGGKISFESFDWSGGYQLKPYPIYDNACKLNRGMYREGTYQCVSFSANKPLNIGKGGMIFTDNLDAVAWFKLARYEGREEIPLLDQTDFQVLGWNMYMTPEQAARGLHLSLNLHSENMTYPKYPDLSKFSVFR